MSQAYKKLLYDLKGKEDLLVAHTQKGEADAMLGAIANGGRESLDDTLLNGNPNANAQVNRDSFSDEVRKGVSRGVARNYGMNNLNTWNGLSLVDQMMRVHGLTDKYSIDDYDHVDEMKGNYKMGMAPAEAGQDVGKLMQAYRSRSVKQMIKAGTITAADLTPAILNKHSDALKQQFGGAMPTPAQLLKKPELVDQLLFIEYGQKL